MIVVEGPDGSGKTTLVRKLSKALDWPIAPKVVNSRTAALVDLTSWVEDNVSKGFHEVIYDRHRLISEPIYGPLLRPNSELAWPKSYDLEWTSDMVLKFWKSLPIVIFCMPSLDVITGRLVGDPDNERIFPYIDQIYRGYVSAAAWMADCSYCYDGTTGDYNMLLNWVRMGILNRGGKFDVQ